MRPGRGRFPFFLFTFAIVFLATVSVGHAENYEEYLKALVDRFPKPLHEGETVFDWWPLNKEPVYRCRITGAQWGYNEELIGEEFNLKVVRDEKDNDLFHLRTTGFDEFPYEAIRIEGNRVMVVHREAVYGEECLAVFPLFHDLLFSSESYEYHFLRKAVIESHSDGFHYGPVRSNFMIAESTESEVFSVTSVDLHGAMAYKLVKGQGLSWWKVRGGITIRLTETKPGLTEERTRPSSE